MDENQAALYAEQLAQDEAELERASALVQPGSTVNERTGDAYLGAAAQLAVTRATIAAERLDEAKTRYEKLLIRDQDALKAALAGRPRPTFTEISTAKQQMEKASSLFESERAEAVKLAGFVRSRQIQREDAEERRKAEKAAEEQRRARIQAETDRQWEWAKREYRRRHSFFNFRPGGNL